MATKKSISAKKTSVQQTRHRTSVSERSRVAGYPDKLFIYKSDASSYWWVRNYVAGRVVKKSTKQTLKAPAIAFAKAFFLENETAVSQGLSPSASKSFEVCGREMLKAEKAKLDRSEITRMTHDNLKYRFEKSVLPFFKKFDVQEIEYHDVQQYLEELSEGELSSATISAYLRIVRKVLVHAVRRRMIVSVPEFPVVKVNDVARGWFNTSEYTRLWHAASRLSGVKIEIRKYDDAEGVTHTQYIRSDSTESKLGELMRNVVMTEDMRRLIVFMVNSYIRPTDIKNMKHKHIDVVDDEFKYLRLRLPPSKNHSNPITTMPTAVGTYLALKKHHKDTNGAVKDEDYVFLPEYSEKQRGYALKQLQRQFEVLMSETGLGLGSGGENRTIYSLRHTSIMFRLLYGDAINTLALARNARTSVEMIDRFYAKPLTGEMNIEMLQSRRRRRKYFDGEVSDLYGSKKEKE